MVGRLSLQDVPELVDTKKKGDGVLDSPDSGLPLSPSHWGLAAAGDGAGGGERAPAPGMQEPDAVVTPAAPNPASLPNTLAVSCSPKLCPLSFGEGVEFDPLPSIEVRYTSSIKYDSERHFIDDPVTCIPNGTGRNYKAEVRFEHRPKPTRFLSTIIVYPKYPKTIYTTTLDYNCHKMRGFLGSDCLSNEC
uniref:Refilin-B-like n=1 Tax=Ictidomys tridecemlineatus TaxID=43179 RepID=A0A287D5H3_ICTTR